MHNVEIRILGRLDDHWADWLEGFSMDYTGDVTVLKGSAPDQAAVYGVLSKLRDLGVRLVSVSVEEGFLEI